ncbi:MAG: CPBP family intramembrane metalloprotease [Flavobacteriales bacterium]|nr:MAG: CPBP family intramembrane metalloprotease [Flavobacteriales bacterium]
MNIPRRVLSFIAIAVALTWSIAGVGALLGVRAEPGWAYMALAAACMFMPAVAAIVQQRILDKAPWAGLGLRLKGMNWKMLGATAIVGMLVVPAVFLVVLVCGNIMGLSGFGDVSITNERLEASLETLMAQLGGGKADSATAALVEMVPAWGILVIMLLSAVLTACTFNLPAMLGEELGWRGYLHQHLAGWPTARRIAFVGVVWGLWHAPLIAMGHNYPGYPVAGIGMMVVFCVLAAFLFDWSRVRVGAVWGPCVLHGVLNGSAGAFALFAAGGHVLVGSVVGLAGFVALVLLSLLVLVVDRRYRMVLLTREASPGV